VGAHEVLVQSIRHDIELWQSSDAEISQFLLLTAQRIQDLKGDLRFKYVTMFKNHGASAGQEFDHPVSELTATTFVPRRVLYELRASRDYYMDKERCVFCDTLGQEFRNSVRIVEPLTNYVSCAFASVCRMKSGLCPASTNLPSKGRSLPNQRTWLNWQG
jgi:UDPglucose--hexose-1-phosphate uridylyltransferase